MTTPQQRAARRERTAAKALGSTRVVRERGESAPDLRPVDLPCGVQLIVEVKNRAALPALHRRALEQARCYAPGREPAVVASEDGGEQFITLRLSQFARIAGLDAVKLRPQLSLPLAPPGPSSPGEGGEGGRDRARSADTRARGGSDG